MEKSINERLMELEGKELDKEEVKEWARLVNLEWEKYEKKRKKDGGESKDAENVHGDMDGKKTCLRDIRKKLRKGSTDSILSSHTPKEQVPASMSG